MKFVLAQLNLVIGDLSGNANCIKEACLKAKHLQADLVITSELSLLGYPPKDLLLNPEIIQKQYHLLNELALLIKKEAKDLSLLIGIAENAKGFHYPKLFNSVALVNSSGWEIVARKKLLPTYDVFDETRYFRAANHTGLINLRIKNQRLKIGLTVCEDLWVEEAIQDHRILGPDPIEELISEKIDLLINISASPYCISKLEVREEIAKKAVKRLQCPVIYLNQIGGNDELIFDGMSFVLDKNSKMVLSLPFCEESITLWDSDVTTFPTSKAIHKNEQIFKALVLGVKDYSSKCGFQSAIIGLSGGIDSALVTAIASAALGAEKVNALLMPSPWSSKGSIQDSIEFAQRLKITTQTLPINSLMKEFDKVLLKTFGENPKGITAENLQSRIRGTLLMAFANEQNHLLLSTGNKSELAVGYCTLYGDMNGGLSVIGDLYKTSVFELCEWLDNQSSKDFRKSMGLPSQGEIIGKTIRTKAPSAELSPGQVDSDSLPEYVLLDQILKGLIEHRKTKAELIEITKEPSIVDQIMKMLQKGEFKRRQAPPLLKVTSQAFGTGWRIPIAAK